MADLQNACLKKTSLRKICLQKIWRRASSVAGATIALQMLVGATMPVQAQDYPTKLIKFIVPSPPGGGTDTLARLVAAKLSETLKWQIVADNRPGAGGNVGMDAAAKAPPDGYTIAMGESSNLTINPYLYATIPFDAAKDLVPVVLVGTVPLVLVTSPSSQFDSIAAVVAAAKAKPLFFASGGNGTVGHLTGEIWMRRAGVTLQHVPYRGGAQAVADVMGGQVDLNFARSRRPRRSSKPASCAPWPSRLPGVRPNCRLVPTFDEAGFQGLHCAGALRRRRTGRYAAGNRRTAQCRDQPRASGTGLQGERRQERRGDPRRHAGGIRCVLERRTRQVVARSRRFRRAGGLIDVQYFSE